MDTPTLFTIEAATASVGLTIAPKAIPHPSPRPGISQAKNVPRIRALATTSATDRPLIAVNSRRKSIAGIDTDAEYKSGGSTPVRIQSGSTWTAGTNGSKLAPMPVTTSSSGAATPKRRSSVVAAVITSSARTTTIRNPTALPPSPGYRPARSWQWRLPRKKRPPSPFSRSRATSVFYGTARPPGTQPALCQVVLRPSVEPQPIG